ncbi:MAG: c-type cytochrome biogenesis protein CcmF, partial [Burkholderiaceae bacterium]|nr:c-type cytochrome biogenesis protein CcmF [Burkholderiaceae bacterium]
SSDLDTVTLGDCTLHFEGMAQRNGPNYNAQAGRFTLRCGARPPRALVSEKRVYIGSDMPLTQSAIDWNMARDIYVALSAPIDQDVPPGAWSLRVQYKPFMRWVWLGVLLMGAGALSAALTRRLRRAAPSSASIAAAAPGDSPPWMEPST